MSVWTPTAQRVELLRWPSASEGADPEVHAMDRDDEHGVWSCPMADTWRGQQYLFRCACDHRWRMNGPHTWSEESANL